jgi:hypothetical protein
MKAIASGPGATTPRKDLSVVLCEHDPWTDREK